MKKYIGTKLIEAEPLEKDGASGYKVRYKDGYESWSPKETFEEAYTPVEGPMSFSKALELLKGGMKIARKGWNGKGMFLSLILPGNAEFRGYPMQVCIGMKTADDKMQPGWLASQADLLTDDWEAFE